MAKKKKTMYVCQNCGYDNTRWMGKCPGCGAWNTMVEEVVAPPAEERRGTASAGEPPQPIAEIRAEDLPRFSTGSG
ncbi:MAG: DNA repair protein RadA, partial [Selenomonas sp.]|nr:DNA repair protein RadA [Selenomonas sp.]